MIGPFTRPTPPKPLNEFPYRVRDQIAFRILEALLRDPDVLREYTPKEIALTAYETVKELEKASNAS
jgi:hypothetical protein